MFLLAAEFQADYLYQTESVRFQLQTEVEENGDEPKNSIQHPGIDTDAQATTYGQNHAFLAEMEAERLLRVLVKEKCCQLRVCVRACHSNLHASQDQDKRDLFTFNCSRNNIIKKHKLSTCQ
jgi:hypothetical protein